MYSMLLNVTLYYAQYVRQVQYVALLFYGFVRAISAHRTVPRCTVSYCTVSNCTVLFCNVFYYIVCICCVTPEVLRNLIGLPIC